MQQGDTQGSDENSGSILDGQTIVVDPSVAASYPQNDNGENPREALENADQGLDDRYSHMLDVENDQESSTGAAASAGGGAAGTGGGAGNAGGPPVITAPVTTAGDPIETPGDDIQVTFSTTSTTQQTARSPYNYILEDFDSSVKHDVYPSPETDRMITWGVFAALGFL